MRTRNLITTPILTVATMLVCLNPYQWVRTAATIVVVTVGTLYILDTYGDRIYDAFPHLADEEQ